MASLSGFDANQHEPNQFDAIPAGKYEAVISESEMKPTKTGNGSYLNITFTVTEGEYANRKVWARLNLDNPNATAVKIARGELSAICRAIGVMTPADSTELHNLPLIVKVTCKKNEESGDITNEIKGYYPVKDEPKTEPAKKAAPATAAGVKGWMGKK